MTATCSVCCQPYTQVLRSVVDCDFCDYKACKQCHMKYLLSITQDAHCMSCRVGWNRGFIASTFSKNFGTGALKEHRENLLYNNERSLFPASQIHAERYKEDQALFDVLSARYTELSHMIRHSQDDVSINRELITEQILVSNHMRDINRRIREMMDGIASITTVRRFVRACPMEGCRGFLDTDWNCGLCNTQVCSRCHETKPDEDHVCRIENLETAQLLETDSKPCPNCASMIFRVSGCDQMFCTQCATAFSWNTGVVEVGRIHNPHYYQFLRTRAPNMGREVGDIPCGGIPNIFTVNMKVNSLWEELKERTIMRIRMGRLVMHCTHVELVVLPSYTNATIDNSWLRVEFLIGKISEKQFKSLLMQRDQKLQFHRDIAAVGQMYIIVISEILQRFCAAETKEGAQEVLREIIGVNEFTTEAINKIKVTYYKKPSAIAHGITVNLKKIGLA